jgi:hypothetical protein
VASTTPDCRAARLDLGRRAVLQDRLAPRQFLQRKLAAPRPASASASAMTPNVRLSLNYYNELHFALSPVVLGQGEAMFAGIDLPALGYRVTEHQATEHATHIVLSR